MRRTILIAAALVMGMSPLAAQAFDGQMAGHWRSVINKPEGTWTIDWTVKPDGSYHSVVSGPAQLPEEDGQLSCDAGKWNVRAVTGRTDKGSYLLTGDTLTLHGLRDITKWTRVKETHNAPAVATKEEPYDHPNAPSWESKPSGIVNGGAPVTLPSARVLVGFSGNEVVHSGPVNPAARALYDQAMKAKDADQYERALQLLTMAIKTSPGFVDARYQRGVCINKMVDAGQTPGELTHRMLPRTIFGKANLIWMAIDDFNAVIGLQPNNAKAICMRGLCYLESLQYNEAIEDFNRAIALNPSYSFPYGYRALAHIDTFQPEGNDLQRAIALDPVYTDYWHKQEKDCREFRYEYKALQEEMKRRMEAAANSASSYSSSSSSSSNEWSSSDRARANSDWHAAERLDRGTASYEEKRKYGGW